MGRELREFGKKDEEKKKRRNYTNYIKSSYLIKKCEPKTQKKRI
jgi:hypothetical protein